MGRDLFAAVSMMNPPAVSMIFVLVGLVGKRRGPVQFTLGVGGVFLLGCLFVGCVGGAAHFFRIFLLRR